METRKRFVITSYKKVEFGKVEFGYYRSREWYCEWWYKVYDVREGLYPFVGPWSSCMDYVRTELGVNRPS